MKIQSLAVIFVIVILPISIILSEYVQAQIYTLNLQTSYDAKLVNSTYDAVVAFQKNTVNSTASQITTSKIRDIEASANTFLNSIASNFGLSGNAKNAMEPYIPALVYTLYDGYYIYSPYTNTINTEDTSLENRIEIEDGSTYTEGKKIYGLKPYIYYSREYHYNGGDFVITYSLDNYITIQGKKADGTVINDSGYLIDPSDTNVASDGSIYKGKSIGTDAVEEYVDRDTKYPCVKVNGVKYYLNENNKVFSYVQNERIYLSGSIDVTNTSAYNFEQAHPFYNNSGQPYNDNARRYYKEAKAFSQRVEDYGLTGLHSHDAKIYRDEATSTGKTAIQVLEEHNEQADYSIFPTNLSDIENPNSEFNQERQAVIRYAIEKNLSAAIANYNNFASNTSNNFEMPNLKDDEWDKIINNISVISFLQGFNMGTKSYNGYAIVTNNKNIEAVAEDSIYITTAPTSGNPNGEYHRVTDSDLTSSSSGLTLRQGIFNVDFERKSIADSNGNVMKYYYPNKATGCYSSIVNQYGIDQITLKKADGTDKNIHEYLADTGNNILASIYYTALGRERQGLYRVNNPVETYTTVN